MAGKIKSKSGTQQGFEIIANREGLMGLAAACLQMAMRPEDNEQAKQSTAISPSGPIIWSRDLTTLSSSTSQTCELLENPGTQI